MVIGANAVWLAAAGGSVDQSLLVLLPAAALASLLPDIDAAGGGAKIHYLKGLGRIFALFRGSFGGRYFHHRGLMHSLFVTFIFFAVLVVIFDSSYPTLPYIFVLSYFSHAFIDGFNAPVGYLYPFTTKRYALVPRLLRTPVKGAVDNLLFFLGAFSLLLFLFIYHQSFFPQSF